jgi:Na+-transporting methylmalonyl-CoA/oxaloacetate decarboxylase gamma subunit
VRPRGRGDDGSAVVEFLGVALVLLVPLVYLVLVVGRLQAATFAAESAANEAVRVFVTAADQPDGERLAVAAVGMSFEDQHLPLADPAGAVRLECPSGCGVADATVTGRVHVDVPLPGVPAFVRSHVPLSIGIEAHATGSFGRYADLSGWQ